jgi:hypothetical protein
MVGEWRGEAYTLTSGRLLDRSTADDPEVFV